MRLARLVGAKNLGIARHAAPADQRDGACWSTSLNTSLPQLMLRQGLDAKGHRRRRHRHDRRGADLRPDRAAGARSDPVRAENPVTVSEQHEQGHCGHYSSQV